VMRAMWCLSLIFHVSKKSGVRCQVSGGRKFKCTIASSLCSPEPPSAIHHTLKLASFS
jgi:hypothetical protein